MIYDRILIQIRERSFLDLLDLTLLVVRERPLPLFLAGLVGIAPFAVLDIWIIARPEVPFPVWFWLLLIEAPWATAPLTLVLGDLMFGSPISWRRYVKTLVVSLPTMVLTQFFMRGLLVLTIFGYAIVTYRFAFLNEVILLERLRWFESLGRTKKLVRGIEGELFGRWLAQVIFGTIFVLCFWMGTRVIGSAVAGGELTWREPGAADMGKYLIHSGAWIAIAFFAVYRFLAYIDRRIRLEGWELELRLKEAGRVLEERAD